MLIVSFSLTSNVLLAPSTQNRFDSVNYSYIFNQINSFCIPQHTKFIRNI